MTFRKPEHSIFKGQRGEGGHLIIIRGCPGSGKSTLARSLSSFHPPSMVHLEADMYWEREGRGYEFDINELNRAHRWCLDTTKVMLQTRSHCCVSNTFTRFAEMLEYVTYAFDNDVELEVYSLTSEFQNQHNVPPETLQRMRDRFQSHEYIMKQVKDLYNAKYLPI